jgi:hypothetical protein
MENIVTAVENEAIKVVDEVKAEVVKVVDDVEGKAKELTIEAKLFVREAQLKIKSLEDKAREVQAEISQTFETIRQRAISEAKVIGVDIEKYTLDLEKLVFTIASEAKQELKKVV